METLFTILIILHGLVHLLYLAQSRQMFELKPAMTWPAGSWAFSRLFGDSTTRIIASAFCGLAAIGFVAGGIGILAAQGWWRPVVTSASIFSAVGYLLFWNGRTKDLDGQGAIGIVINIGILILVVGFRQPAFAF